MTHKKAIRYFKPRKKTPAKATFRLMRAGFWRSASSRALAAFTLGRHSSIADESLSRDSLFSRTPMTRRWLSTRAQRFSVRGATPKLKLRCIFVGRGRSTSQELFMARHTFRKFLRLGMLPGFIKLTKL